MTTSVEAKALSPRHLDCLVLVAEGRSNKEIGERLFVSEDTVKTHLRRAYSCLGARDRAHAVAIAIVEGYLRVALVDDELQVSAPLGTTGGAR